jgi:hypothetical protein
MTYILLDCQPRIPKPCNRNANTHRRSLRHVRPCRGLSDRDSAPCSNAAGDSLSSGYSDGREHLEGEGEEGSMERMSINSNWNSEGRSYRQLDLATYSFCRSLWGIKISSTTRCTHLLARVGRVHFARVLGTSFININNVERARV